MGPPLKRSVKNVIYNVHKFFLKRKADEDSFEHKMDMNIYKLVAEATGVSARSVFRIVGEGNSTLQSSGQAKFSSRSKPKEIKKKINVDDFNKGVIRRKIHQFYTLEKRIPSVGKLNAALKEDGIVDCSCTYLRTLLHKIGFTFKKCKSKRSILIERPSIVEWRNKYLRAIQQYRDENRNIYYIDETYVNSSHNSSECQQSELEHVKGDNGKGLFIIHGGSKDGLVDGALTILKSDSKHSDMDATNFHNWVDNKLKNALTPDSVVVMDNASYHCVQEVKKPTISSLKGQMQDWLREHNINFTQEMTKSELLGLINRTQNEKVYTIDVKLEAAGHTVLRLPPYHPDLNPMELVWANIKNDLATKYISSTLDEKITILTRLFSQFTAEKWQKLEDRVKKIETQYWSHDMMFDTVMDELFINHNNESDSSEDSESEYSEEEEDMDI